jgi:hypothetical protein
VTLQVPLKDIIAGHVNEAGVIYDPLRKDFFFAEEMNALEGRMVSGQWSINPFSIACAGTEVLSEDRDGFLRGLLAEGPVGPILREGAGSRLLWHAGKKAFRVGEVTGSSTAWDDAEIGVGSHAIGTDVRAIDNGAVVVGSGVDGANPLTSTAIDEILFGQGSDVPTVRVTPGTGVGTVGKTAVGLGATSPTALLDVGASTTGRASLRLRSGVAPTSPNEGDLWVESGAVLAWVGGSEKDLSSYNPPPVSTVQTTDATPTTIWTAAFVSGDGLLIEANVVGRSSSGTDHAAYVRRALIYRSGLTMYLVGPVDKDFTRETDSAWNVDIVIVANSAVVQVTGKAATTIDWSALVVAQFSGGIMP